MTEKEWDKIEMDKKNWDFLLWAKNYNESKVKKCENCHEILCESDFGYYCDNQKCKFYDYDLEDITED